MSKNKILYSLGRIIVRLYARLMFNLDIRWYDDPSPGPKLFVANHPSATDPFLIHLISPQPMSVLITVNAFTVPLLGYYLRKTRQICVDPSQGSAALEEARRLLENGRPVAVFPEGLISPQEGGFHSPRSGAARLALKTGVPVIPVGIYLPRERTMRITSGISGKKTTANWYLRGPYSVTVGQPMKFEGNAEDREQVRGVTHRIMESIRAMAQESEQRLRRRRLVKSPV
ncbi:MAG: lysophospholipid acyltransferase family protein [Anaerolineales bacterium]|nr:lysophospholipid acyltransferase family protein [Anaerolineales bacterium]